MQPTKWGTLNVALELMVADLHLAHKGPTSVLSRHTATYGE
jgi:hypothetical protein